MKIKITYKNGNIIENKINYLHVDTDAIYYTVDRQVHNMIQTPVTIPLKNIETYEIIK